MNLRAIIDRQGVWGSIERVVYDLQTSVKTSSPKRTKIGMARRDYATEVSGEIKKQPVIAMLSHEMLVEAGFPVPVQNGDIIRADGLVATIRQVQERISRDTKVYYVQGESTPQTA